MLGLQAIDVNVAAEVYTQSFEGWKAKWVSSLARSTMNDRAPV